MSVHETTEEGESLLSLACSAGYYELAQVRRSIMSREKSNYCQLPVFIPAVLGMFLGLPDPLVRGADPDPSLFA